MSKMRIKVKSSRNRSQQRNINALLGGDQNTGHIQVSKAAMDRAPIPIRVSVATAADAQSVLVAKVVEEFQLRGVTQNRIDVQLTIADKTVGANLSQSATQDTRLAG
jgi:hypothetical protein